MHSSKAMMMSAPRASCTAMEDSGVRHLAGTVEMGLEAHPLLVDAAQIPQAEDLKAAAVGQNRPIPVHEAMQSPELANQFMPGAQKQMVGIGQNDLGSDLLEGFGQHPLDRPLGSDRHENRGFHRPPPGLQPPAPGPGTFV